MCLVKSVFVREKRKQERRESVKLNESLRLGCVQVGKKKQKIKSKTAAACVCLRV
jgi:hypothetical protein